MVCAFPAIKQKTEAGFQFPAPIGTRMLVHEAEELRDLIRTERGGCFAVEGRLLMNDGGATHSSRLGGELQRQARHSLKISCVQSHDASGAMEFSGARVEEIVEIAAANTFTR